MNWTKLKNTLGFNESVKTTCVGYFLIALGVWAFKVHWVPGQSLWFNLMYACLAPMAFIAAGIVAILCREQGAHDKSKNP